MISATFFKGMNERNSPLFKLIFIICLSVAFVSCNKLKDNHEFLLGEWTEVDKDQPFSVVFTQDKIVFNNIFERKVSQKIKSIEREITFDKNRKFYFYSIESKQYQTWNTFLSNLSQDTLFFDLYASVASDENLNERRILVKKKKS